MKHEYAHRPLPPLCHREPTLFFLELEGVSGLLGVVASWCLCAASGGSVGLQGTSAMTVSGVLEWELGTRDERATGLFRAPCCKFGACESGGV